VCRLTFSGTALPVRSRYGARNPRDRPPGSHPERSGRPDSCENTSYRKESLMKTVQISLNSIDKVKSFVNDLTKFDDDFDLVSGRYVIDAKSIMGIFSLDLSRPIDLNIHATDNIDEILKVLDRYIVK
jgi:phosphotransferase system HPr-like phosphotransfer protein